MASLIEVMWPLLWGGMERMPLSFPCPASRHEIDAGRCEKECSPLWRLSHRLQSEVMGGSEFHCVALHTWL